MSSLPVPAADRGDAWVEATLESLSLAEKLGHLVCPEDRKYSPEQWADIVRTTHPGSVFFGPTPPERLRACLEAIQAASRIPVLVAADLEHGAGSGLPDATTFPQAMGLGVARDAEAVREVGRATAREARARGVHWTFSPVVDLAFNFRSPVVNIRALGDDPEAVATLAAAWIEGLQEGGLMAACAKHFPGDGDDDRDQHLCTSVNPRRRASWEATFGRVWTRAIAAGVKTIMAGHIALPAWEEGVDPADAPPATLSRRVQVDLLRGKLGFRGVLVSDAAPMLGLTSRVPMGEACVANILAGSDVFLFSHPTDDPARLRAAVETGRLSMEAVDASVRRVLALKASLGLDRDVFAPMPSAGETDRWRDLADDLGHRAVCALRRDDTLPLRLPPGARLHLANLRMNSSPAHLDTGLSVAAEELRARGFEVTVTTNPSHNDLVAHAHTHDATLINFIVPPHGQIGSIRLVGEAVFCLWRGPWLQVPGKPFVFTSFGSPFHLDELPHLPNFLATLGASPACQRAAVAAWLGERVPAGTLPVARFARAFEWL